MSKDKLSESKICLSCRDTVEFLFGGLCEYCDAKREEDYNYDLGYDDDCGASDHIEEDIVE